MIGITVHNVNYALHYLGWRMYSENISDSGAVQRSSSRNGEVFRFLDPVCITYLRPQDRVYFEATRDANPFFHLMESLWMLAGRNDVAFVAHYVKRMAEFSDNGVTLNGAYGYRWRRHFMIDQLKRVVDTLEKDKDSRRAVLQMWDGKEDLNSVLYGSKDVPCNLSAVFQINADCLDMTVFNRSNDMVWGATGANAVHFSFLQEYIAAKVGVAIGRYHQVSANMHLYLGREDTKRLFYETAQPIFNIDDRYSSTEKTVSSFPIATDGIEKFEKDLTRFMSHEPGVLRNIEEYETNFFKGVVLPIEYAHKLHKDRATRIAIAMLEQCIASDWRVACQEWLQRRLEKQNG